MTRKVLGIVGLGAIAVLGLSLTVLARDNRPPPEIKAAAGANPGVADASASKGLAAIQRAADAQKYLFLFFYQAEDDQTRAMRPIFDATMQKVADKAEGIVINTADPAEKSVVAKFKVDRAPMPLVLALAPNGAITGGYPLKFDEQVLMGAFCSRSTWESLKALQDGKIVFLCVQNKSTQYAAEALQAVRGAKADPKYAATSEIVMLDPADQSEADAVKRLNIDPQLEEAMTILIAPPVTIVNRFKGATTKEAILAEIQKAAAGKGGCCPGGSCGPKPAAAAQPAQKPQPSATVIKPQPAANTPPTPTKPGPAGKP